MWTGSIPASRKKIIAEHANPLDTNFVDGDFENDQI